MGSEVDFVPTQIAKASTELEIGIPYHNNDQVYEDPDYIPCIYPMKLTDVPPSVPDKGNERPQESSNMVFGDKDNDLDLISTYTCKETAVENIKAQQLEGTTKIPNDVSEVTSGVLNHSPNKVLVFNTVYYDEPLSSLKESTDEILVPCSHKNNVLATDIMPDYQAVHENPNVGNHGTNENTCETHLKATTIIEPINGKTYSNNTIEQGEKCAHVSFQKIDSILEITAEMNSQLTNDLLNELTNVSCTYKNNTLKTDVVPVYTALQDNANTSLEPTKEKTFGDTKEQLEESAGMLCQEMNKLEITAEINSQPTKTIQEDISSSPCTTANTEGEDIDRHSIDKARMQNGDVIETTPVKESNQRNAAIRAVHLVSDVLEEAWVFAKHALDLENSWIETSASENPINSGNDNNNVIEQERQLEALNSNNLNENNIETAAKIVATSTPQKNAPQRIDYSDITLTPSSHDSTLVGQGDEEIETHEDSTSTYINQLFNMSEVERVIFCDAEDTNVTQNISECNMLSEAMGRLIMDSYVANPLQPVDNFPVVMSTLITNPFHHLEECNDKQYEREEVPADMLSRSDESEYSFLTDALVADIGRDVTFYIDEGHSSNKKIFESLQSEFVTEKVDDNINENGRAIEQENHSDFQGYENAYATLNRDYDQCSEGDVYPILQDPKDLILQEVELMTSNTPDEQHSPNKPISESKKQEPDISTNESRKSTLARRCRYQGAKLIACLRGWWRRKTLGNRKETKRSGCPVCPLSPSSRRRTSSSLDHRLLRSPSPHPRTWKFNTVNEVIVTSNRWKDYTFDDTPEGRRDI